MKSLERIKTKWKLRKDKNKMETEEKVVIPFRDWGLAAENVAWNGPSEVRKSDIETLRKISTWFKSPGDTKDDFKLPHHRSNDLKLVLRGLQAAGAAVQGARGGVNIPSSDMPGVRAHLGRHFRQFNRTPPWEKAIGVEFDNVTMKLSNSELEHASDEHVALLKRQEELKEDILKDLGITEKDFDEMFKQDMEEGGEEKNTDGKSVDKRIRMANPLMI
jgi:hypothetical protein